MDIIAFDLNLILPPAIAAIATLLQDDADENGDETEVALVGETVEAMISHLIHRVGRVEAGNLLAQAGYEETE